MTIKQISIFIENRPESLLELTEVLAKHKINMRALSLADTNDFGIARIIVDSPDSVAEMLTDEGYIVKATNVIALEIPDETGSLNKSSASSARTDATLSTCTDSRDANQTARS